MTHFQRRVAAAAALGLVALAVSGCGGSPSTAAEGEISAAQEAYLAFDEMPDDTRMDELVKAAEEEGTVTAYLRSDDVFAELEAAFEAKYEIDLRIVNPGRVSIVRQQIFEQSSAGRLEADVVETYTHELNTMYAESGVVAEIPEFLGEEAVSPDLISPHAIETIQYPFMPVWNSSLVQGENVPQTVEDYLNPIWANKLVMATGNEAWYLTEFQRRTADGMSVPEFEKLFRTIAANASSADSNNPAAAGIASGQYLGGIGIAMVSAQRIGATAPIAWEGKGEPTVVIPAGLGLLREAKNPAAAMLFSQWYMTEGSDIIEKEQFAVQNPAEKDLAGSELVRPDYKELDGKKLEAWRVAYDNLLKGSESVVPEYVK